MPAREAEEVADVVWRCECWELMLELGGLADARPIHVKQQCTAITCKTMIQMWHVGPRL